MTSDSLLNHFHRVAEAPDAVPRLRQFILDVAVRGKLVEQDFNDEPASELFKRIEARRANANGTRKRKANSFSIGDSKTPFSVPAGWLWLRFGSIHDLVRGVTYTKSDLAETQTPDHRPILRANNISASLTFEDLVFVRKECIGPEQMLRRGDYLIALSSGSKKLVGKAAFVTADFAGGFGGFCGVVRLVSPQLEPFVGIFLSSRLYRDAISAGSRGIGINNLKRETLNDALFPLPPLAEQHRIVVKVDELMELCDRLEAAQTERESRRDRLVAASLHRLNVPANAEDKSAVRDHARFHLAHLPCLANRPEHIARLRQTILNFAIRGQLVPQEPNDEPVPAAFKQSNLLDIDFDVAVFSAALSKMTVPAHWCVAPLAKVSSAVVDCPHSTPKWTTTGKICVRTNQFRPGRLDLSDVRFVSEITYLERIQRLQPIENDILYSREGGILGIACRVPPDAELCLGQRMMLIRAGEALNPAFLEMVLNSPLITDLARIRTTGGAAPRVNVATVKAYPIPLPPLAEQGRIVAKVEELMALCDRLEAALSTAQTESRRLLEAVLHEALDVA